jgi:hypothetical protein
VSDRSAQIAFWQWARSPSGIWIEIAPAALSKVFALDERMQRSLQSRLFAVAELAAVHPVPGPVRNLIVTAGGFDVHYSLDLASGRVTVEALEESDRSNLELAG